ncbi:hypothetical protein PG991_014763 [Apiospora marii]|uniref:2EXR domain-containing protein n=1 Tax=Apiospora marii TaxID=335849 RepID=A0ABR1R4G2_9PEZI
MATPTFHPFPRLPAELQLAIWEEALREDRRYVLVDTTTHFRSDQDRHRRTVMGVTPTPNLRRALLEVCHTSRAEALKRCTVRLDVWERPQDMLEDYLERLAPRDQAPDQGIRDTLLYFSHDRQAKSSDYNLRFSAIETVERWNQGSVLDSSDQRVVYRALSPKVQQFVRDKTRDYSSIEPPLTADALRAAIRRAQKSPKTRGDNIWAHKFPSAPTTKRGAIYIDPARDVFVVADTLPKKRREQAQLPGQPRILAPHHRFIALRDFAGGAETTLYHAGPATRAATPAADLRRVPRRALQISQAARYRPGCDYACPHCAAEPFDMKHQQHRDGLWSGLGDAECADYFHVSLRRDLYGLAFCHRAYVDFAVNEHAAILHDLCAGRDLLEVWGSASWEGFCRLT